MIRSLVALVFFTACTSEVPVEAPAPGAGPLALQGPGLPATVGQAGGTVAGISLNTVGWGREGALLEAPAEAAREGGCWSPPGRLQPVSCVPTLARAVAGATERFRRAGDGIGQSWDLHEPPAGKGPLRIDVQVTGATPALDGDTVRLTTPTGERWTYTGLHAWDARGVELRAHLSVQGDRIRVHVDDTGAQWPLHVDPVLSTVSRTITDAGGDFGIGVAMNGNFNGDAYNDLIVGARWGTNLYGEASSYHGSANGISSTYSRRYLSPNYYAKFGEYVDAGGDVNNDGYDDAIVGEFYTAKAYIYLGSASGLGATAATTINGPYGFGRGVAIVGDMNGDGYDDVVGGSGGDLGLTVYKGQVGGVNTTLVFTITTLEAPPVATGGDVDNDGYADLLWGDRASDAAYLRRGNSTFTGSTTTLTRSGSVDFGYSVAGGGDLNNDGYDDVLVGDPAYGGRNGRVTIFWGSASGLSNGSYRDITAPASGAGFGEQVAMVGDVNGDGYDDFAVADDYSNYYAYIYHGGPSPSSTPVNTINGGANIGFAMSGGDSNNDGYSDVVLGNLDSRSALIYHGCPDVDSDGQCSDVDCNDNDPAINTNATEVVGDNIDKNCDGRETCYVNSDGDAYRTTGTITSLDADCNDSGEALATLPSGDCNDNVASINPGAAEVTADGIDQNCDNRETCYANSDGDAYRTTSTVSSSDADCTDAGEALSSLPAGDCNDNSGAIYPNATELPGDGVDQNCDNAETCYTNNDGDAYRTTSSISSADADCTDPGEALSSLASGDCNDNSNAIYPNATELPGDGVDQNCDNAETCYANNDGDAYRTSSTVSSADADCSDAGEALSSLASGDCNDNSGAIYPNATELPGDGTDQNCDNAETCYANNDGDAYRTSSTVSSADADCTDPGEALSSLASGDCNDNSGAIYPNATELPGDGTDQNCDNAETCYANNDGDAYRTSSTVSSADADCTDAGEALSSLPAGDCNDNNGAIYPNATELPGDGVDQNCDNAESCYANNDGDNYRTNSTVSSADADCNDVGEALSSLPAGDCDDNSSAIYPNATELPGDGTDQNCDNAETCYANNDGDNYRTTSTVGSADADCSDAGEALSSLPAGDCNDNSGAIYPNATELPGDGVDQNCDNAETCYANNDGDNYRTNSTVSSADADCTDAGEGLSSLPTGDCNDSSSSVYPGAPETTGDGVDQDCDGVDVCYTDDDNDGYRTQTERLGTTLACTGPGEADAATPAGDCDDSDGGVNPGATEVAGDGVDSDCGTTEICYVDNDLDGFGGSTTTASADLTCASPGLALVGGEDCDDQDLTVHPDATELPGDDVDQDCDETEICYVDNDGDGYRDLASSTVPSDDVDCTDAGEASESTPGGDCDDDDAAFNPGATEADCTDTTDYNCDGASGFADNDDDGFPACEECDDSNALIHPDATEVCDEVDNDCDGTVDVGATDATPFSPDADGDGFTAETGAVDACAAPTGYAVATDPVDCDDGDASVAPDAEELPDDGIDQDCDGDDLITEDSDPPEDTDAPGKETGCACTTSQPSGLGWGLLAGLGALLRRRRSEGR